MNASKEENRACLFSSSTPRRKKTAKSFCKGWASKLAENDKSSYCNQAKWLKDDKVPEKPIETTAESNFTSFLVSRVSFLGREAVKPGTKSREVQRHIKLGRRTVLKVYCSRREASRKIPGISLLSIFPGKCWTFRKCIKYKWAWLNLACTVWKWKLPVANNQWCFLDNRKDQREQSLCSSVVGFRF